MDPDERSDIQDLAREVAREEVASLAGLILRRLQDVRDEDLADDLPDYYPVFRSIWGEVLADFSGHTGSGEEPG